jgi:hypothetical protein
MEMLSGPHQLTHKMAGRDKYRIFNKEFNVIGQ